MDKRYQVFVSSTFRDLEKERSEVIQALLELECIPCGMELFPAADESQWNYIQGIIDDCDYYVVVLAGKYGSISPDTGKSYTQMEYEYARSKDIPTIAFLHKNPSSLPMERNEAEPAMRDALKQFREDVETRLCKHWESADQLGAVVSRSMTQLIKARPAVGWVRADRVTDESAAQEILRLRHQIDELEAENKNLQSGVVGISPEELEQGQDYLPLRFAYSEFQSRLSGNEEDDTEEDEDYDDPWKKKTTTLNTTWDDVFKILAPKILRPTSEAKVRDLINEVLWDRRPSWRGGYIRDLAIIDSYFQKVKAQFMVLGLIEVTESDDPIFEVRWSLSTKGSEYWQQVMAVKKRGRNRHA